MLKTILPGAAQICRAILNCQTLHKYTTNLSYIILQLSRGMKTLRAIFELSRL